MHSALSMVNAMTALLVASFPLQIVNDNVPRYHVANTNDMSV